MNYIKRSLEKAIKESIFKGKAIILFGARQVGKTTLIEKVLQKNNIQNNVLYLNGDDADVRQGFLDSSVIRLKHLTEGKKIIFIDEAQRISDIGVIIKIFTDRIKDIQVIATGSSAFELSSGIQEALTGRKFEFNLFPLNFRELSAKYGVVDEKRNLEHRLVYGAYPEIVIDTINAKRNLKSLSGSYLYKDLFILENIKKPVVLDKLLRALALQIGSEVNYSELATLVGVSKNTVERYIDLLEKTFVIFTLPALSRNIRNEIKKGKKIFFYDCGIRNAIIGNFNSVDNRSDLGALWENYLMAERMKLISDSEIRPYFWRTVQQQEIDYVEENNGVFNTYEFKWNPKKSAKLSKTFQKGYPHHTFSIINRNNYDDFLCF